MNSFLVLFGLLALATAVPLHKATDDDRVPGEYVIVFRSDAVPEKLVKYMADAEKQGVNLDTYQIGDTRGAFATLTPEQLEKHLLEDDVLEFISENRIHTIVQSCVRQDGAEWNLERVSERVLELGNMQGYTYEDIAGQGVTSYIIDTGIYIAHNEFQGRASWGTNTIDTNNNDCHGHGTHVAATVAGAIYGVAKKTTLVAVKVLNCQGSGTSQSVIRGIEWVTNNHRKPANANMSLGGGNDPAMVNAVEASIRAGVVYAIAAGNSNADACNYSPANAPNAITVGATTIEPVPGSPTEEQEDIRSSFSNYGRCLDIFAPGTLITSAWIGSPSATRTISGTSMAAPHVAGLVSLIQSGNPTWGNAQIISHMNNMATVNVIDLNCGAIAACSQSANRMIYGEC